MVIEPCRFGSSLTKSDTIVRNDKCQAVILYAYGDANFFRSGMAGNIRKTFLNNTITNKAPMRLRLSTSESA